MTIGDRIKERRLTLKITQESVALRVKVTKQTIQKYENNIITNIPSDKIELLADVLRCSPGYLMGWEDTSKLKEPNITEDFVTFPVIGELAAGYDRIALEDWTGETVDVPSRYLKGHKTSEFIVLQVKGSSMYPFYLEGDKVLIYKQSSVNSGAVAAILYDNEYATLKKVEFGTNYMKLIPYNPEYQPKEIWNEDLNHCRVIGTPKLLIRDI